MLSQRNRLGERDIQWAQEALQERLKTMELALDSGYVYGYYPLGKEAPVLSCLRWALRAGKRVALPKVHGQDMDFYEIQSLEDVGRGHFGVMEPLQTRPVFWEEALCLTPGVGFDQKGNRLGHGGGYYDRYFSMHGRLLKVGIAYDFQVIEEIPAQQWDVPMDYCITPSSIWAF